MKQTEKVLNSFGYVATKIQFHFWFPSSPDVALSGHIGRLLNWKFEFGWRIIINVANYINYKYIYDDVGIGNITLWLWTFLDFSSRHTVDIASDIVMYHILVGK